MVNKPLEHALKQRLQADEASFKREDPPDTLWDHSLRVAKIASSLGTEEGVDPEICRLAGLFHDAGKLAGGRYHEGDLPEEELSVGVLRDLAATHGLDEPVVDAVANAIRQLYRDDPEPSPLAQILFDADNLDKLGLAGVANFFIKAGLRGRGLSQDLLLSITIELTYARSAAIALQTKAGRARAAKRGAQSEAFFRDLLKSMREDGLADVIIEELEHDGMTLAVAMLRECECGGNFARAIEESQGVKCTRVRLRHECRLCGASHKVSFCRPRL